MTLEWSSPRPLKTGPGRLLATMINDRPNHAYLLATGALDGLGDMLSPPPVATAAEVEGLLVGYLGGVAAAAMVADAATGRRDWTGPQDFAVGGREVEFLRPETVLLGTLTLALAAVCRAMDLAPAWESHRAAPPVPAGHCETLELIQRTLADVTQARMNQVSDRAEEVGGV